MNNGYRPLRGLNIPLCAFPGVRYAHPGLYAAVRSADSAVVVADLQRRPASVRCADCFRSRLCARMFYPNEATCRLKDNAFGIAILSLPSRSQCRISIRKRRQTVLYC
jgi:hypothetical protein